MFLQAAPTNCYSYATSYDWKHSRCTCMCYSYALAGKEITNAIASHFISQIDWTGRVQLSALACCCCCSSICVSVSSGALECASVSALFCSMSFGKQRNAHENTVPSANGSAENSARKKFATPPKPNLISLEALVSYPHTRTHTYACTIVVVVHIYLAHGSPICHCKHPSACVCVCLAHTNKISSVYLILFWKTFGVCICACFFVVICGSALCKTNNNNCNACSN